MNSRTQVNPNANLQIDVEGHCVWFRLDLNNRRWHSLEAPDEAAFPLIKVVSGKRYELYSDGSLANVER
jgi:hypothetical protein